MGDETKRDIQSIYSREHKSFDDLDITDDYMFAYVMRQSDICIALLRSIFPSHGIKSIRYIYADDSDEKKAAAVKPESQKTIAEAFDKKSVRLDTCLGGAICQHRKASFYIKTLAYTPRMSISRTSSGMF